MLINQDSITFTIRENGNTNTVNIDNSKIHHIYLLNKSDIAQCKDNSYFHYFSAWPPPQAPSISQPNERVVWLEQQSKLFLFIFKKRINDIPYCQSNHGWQ
eukprot:104169_1